MKKNITISKNQAIAAFHNAIETRRIWMDALAGRISKEELDKKGIKFINVVE